jgi:hypothetical protein
MCNLYSLFITIALFVFSIDSNAQSISPQSINSNGSKMTQNNGSLSFTVGELVILSYTDQDGNTLSNGFSSSATLSTISIEEIGSSISSIKIYPNPSCEIIHIEGNNLNDFDFQVELIDALGNRVINEAYKAIDNSIKINLNQISTGTFFLSLTDTNKQFVGNYKIIKQ